MAVPDVSVLLSSLLVSPKKQQHLLVVKGPFVAIAKKGKITMDMNLNKKHLGILYAGDAGNFHFSSPSVLFFRLR